MRLEANKALGAMLERATMSERIKSVLSLLKRYESLFALPMRMRQQMQRQEYDQVHGPACAAVCSCIMHVSIKTMLIFPGPRPGIAPQACFSKSSKGHNARAALKEKR